MISKYYKFTSWYTIISFKEIIEKYKTYGITKDDLEQLNKQIEYVKDKLTSNSYKNSYHLIKNANINVLEEVKKLKKISLKKKETVKEITDEIREQVNILAKLIDYLENEEVKRIIVARNVIYDVIDVFWSGVSFLHKKSNKSDMYLEYNTYFILPLMDYIKEVKKGYKYTCFTCGLPISKLSKPASYQMTWINKLGVDVSRKSSHFWDLNPDSFICPVCNFVYSCIPAGFNVVNGKGLFINQNSNIRRLITINKHSLDKVGTLDELEQLSYFKIVENMEHVNVQNYQREIENIQIVKLNTNNQQRPYTFNVLSKYILKLINDNQKLLKPLVGAYVKVSKNEYISIYNEVIKRLYNNQNLFDTIYRLFYSTQNGQFNRLNYIDMIIKINNDFIGGIMKEEKIDNKKINLVRKLGLDLKDAYKEKKAENKLNGISYRLLNALKTKNKGKFMDTLLNSYMYLNKEIPTVFVDSLKDISTFQTLGYSFLLGLQGEKYEGYKNKNKEAE